MLDTWRSVAKETITVYVRVLSLLIGFSLILFGWDMVTGANREAYASPVFDTVRSMAPLTTWGAMFWLAASLFIIAAVSGRFLAYALAMSGAVLAQSGWFAGVLIARFADGATLTTAGIGLWVLAFSLTVGTAFVPVPQSSSEEIHVVDDRDEKLVELRRAG